VLEWRPEADLGRIQIADDRIVGFGRAGLDAPLQAIASGIRVSFRFKYGVWGWVARDVRPVEPAPSPTPVRPSL
jgi:hypothetical protein